MADDFNPTQQPVPTTPVCPHCNDDAKLISSHGPIQLGGLILVMFYCGNSKCRKVWSVAVIGQAQPTIARGIIAPS